MLTGFKAARKAFEAHKRTTKFGTYWRINRNHRDFSAHVPTLQSLGYQPAGYVTDPMVFNHADGSKVEIITKGGFEGGRIFAPSSTNQGVTFTMRPAMTTPTVTSTPAGVPATTSTVKLRAGNLPFGKLVGFLEDNEPSPVFSISSGGMKRDLKFSDMLQFDSYECEHNHKYLQWMFPLDEPSHFHRDVPVAGDDDIRSIRQSQTALDNLKKGFEFILDFYGFRTVDNFGVRYGARPWMTVGRDLLVVPNPDWALISPRWLTKRNHNFLRITRVLKSMMLFGLESEAVAFYKALEHLYYKGGDQFIGQETFDFWTDSVASAL